GEVLYKNPAVEHLLRRLNLQDEDVYRILPLDIDSLLEKISREDKEVSRVEAVVGDRIYSYIFTSLLEENYVNLYGWDITELKKTEEALYHSQFQLSNALKIAHLGPWECDVDKWLFIFTDAFYSIFGTTAEQVGGYIMPAADYARRFIHPDDAHLVADEMRKAIETQDPHYSRQLEHRIIYADGRVGYISVRFFVVKDKNGKTVRTYGVNQDITARRTALEELQRAYEELKATQEKLIQSAKLASIGELAGSIAHELRTPPYRHLK
ncbi:MAG: PAS domain-containing protein, partial [Candidatus Omnitrophica bacterium]|nr:PAS domain-containing protein [Candidatus Omnitrophota bacterium]